MANPWTFYTYARRDMALTTAASRKFAYVDVNVATKIDDIAKEIKYLYFFVSNQ